MSPLMPTGPWQPDDCWKKSSEQDDSGIKIPVLLSVALTSPTASSLLCSEDREIRAGSTCISDITDNWEDDRFILGNLGL